jgi:2-polyprenyl-3-methyl-5-hydroxy-6-metoxy-1,4-benzoquinol methylase
MICPLCNSRALKVRSRIEAVDIVGLWRKSKVDVSHLLKTDLDLVKCENCGLGFYYPIVSGDDRFYSELALWDWYYKHPGKSEYFYASSLISSGDNVIDVGCGIGEFSRHIPEGADFTGIELSSRAVNIAQSMGRNVIQTSVEKAAEDFGSSFDYVICFQVLEHLTDLDSFIPACIDLCKKGGRIIFAVPNNEGFLESAVNNIMNIPPHHTLMWSKDSLFFLANKYGLEIVEFQNEVLQDIHKIWAYTTKVNDALRKLLGQKNKKIDNTLFSRLLLKISKVLALLLIRVRPSLIKEGHSSIITLEK